MEKRDEREDFSNHRRNARHNMKARKRPKCVENVMRQVRPAPTRSSPPTSPPLVPSSGSHSSLKSLVRPAEEHMIIRTGRNSIPESTLTQTLLKHKSGEERVAPQIPPLTEARERYARTPVARVYPQSSYFSSSDEDSHDEVTSSVKSCSRSDNNIRYGDESPPALHLCTVPKCVSHAHCVEITEVLDALYVYINRQAKLIHRLSTQVQEMRRELNAKSDNLSGRSPGPASTQLAPNSTKMYSCSSSSSAQCVCTDELWKQEIRRLVREELHRNPREDGGASMSTTVHTNSPETVASREVLIQHGERLMQLEVSVEEQREDTTTIHQSISKLSEMINGIIKDTQETKVKEELQRRMEQNHRTAELQGMKAAIQQEAKASLRQITSEVVQMAFAERRASFINDHAEDLRQFVGSTVSVQLQEYVNSLHKEWQSSDKSKMYAIQEQLSALQQRCAELSTRLDRTDKEQSRWEEVHHFNTSLYDEFKSWLSDVEERMVNRSEWIQWTHQVKESK